MAIKINILIEHQDDGQFLLHIQSKGVSGKYCRHEKELAETISQQLAEIHKNYTADINHNHKESTNVH